MQVHLVIWNVLNLAYVGHLVCRTDEKESESEGLGGLSAAWYFDLAAVGGGVKNIRLVSDS